MKFVFAAPGWYLGGFATFCRNLSGGLRARGHEVSMLVLPNARPHQAVPPGAFDQCVTLTRGLCGTWQHIAKVAATINQLRPEVLVLNDAPYAMAALPFLDHSILRLPVVHSVSPEEVALGLTNGQWWDRLIAVSDFVANAVSSRGPETQITVCPLGVPLPSIPAKRKGQGHPCPLRILSVSRVVVYQKRMDRVPAIARLLLDKDVDFHWTILGDGEYLPRLRQDIEGLGLKNRFSFPGAVSPAVVGHMLAASDSLVMTSDCEGMPQALLEAMAHGTVPVVSRIPGCTTCLVEEGTHGFLCEPSAAEEFATALARLAQDPGLRQQMGKQCEAIIARRFTVEAFTDRFVAIIDQVRRQVIRRPEPLRALPLKTPQTAYRCLGFWPSLRHQSLGQIKQWLMRAKSKRGPGASWKYLPGTFRQV